MKKIIVNEQVLKHILMEMTKEKLAINEAISVKDAYNRFYVGEIEREIYDAAMDGTANMTPFHKLLIDVIISTNETDKNMAKALALCGAGAWRQADANKRQLMLKGAKSGELDTSSATAFIESLKNLLNTDTTTKKQMADSGLVTLYEDDAILVTCTLSYAASTKYYGMTSWCTASDIGGRYNGFYMFVAAQTSHASSAASEAFCIMHRGQKYKLSHSLQYYYDLLPTYGNTVLSIFSRYWDSLYRISSQLKSIEPDVDNLILPKYEKLCALYQKHGHEPPSLENYAKAFKFPFERSCFSGHVHGCIIDLDYSNHVFFNPYDGTITPYFGTDRVFKYVYENTASLISDRIPEMLPGFLKSGVVINSVLPAALSSTTLENMSSSEIDRILRNFSRQDSKTLELYKGLLSNYQ